MTTFRWTALVALCALTLGAAQAQTTVKDPWVRGTVAQQRATGAFMQITSAQGGQLVGASSPAAGVVEVHEMKMVGDTMKMGAIAALDLPAGKPVELRPGSYHVMLMELKQPLKDGDTVPLTLTIKGADGKTETVQVSAPVKALGAPAQAHGHMHGDMQH